MTVDLAPQIGSVTGSLIVTGNSAVVALSGVLLIQPTP